MTLGREKLLYMSFFPGQDPAPGDQYSCDALERVIVPRTPDLGDGFNVRRALPSAPAHGRSVRVLRSLRPGGVPSRHGLDVRPHPHIGLSTVTYLFDGEIIHRDSLGTAVDPARRGQLDDGRARHRAFRAHRAERRANGDPLHGLQFWVAMPAPKRRSIRPLPITRTSCRS